MEGNPVFNSPVSFFHLPDLPPKDGFTQALKIPRENPSFWSEELGKGPCGLKSMREIPTIFFSLVEGGPSHVEWHKLL